MVTSQDQLVRKDLKKKGPRKSGAWNSRALNDLTAHALPSPPSKPSRHQVSRNSVSVASALRWDGLGCRNSGAERVGRAGLAGLAADDSGSRGLTLFTCSDHGCVQVHWRALQEEAVGCAPLPASRSVRCIRLGVSGGNQAESRIAAGSTAS